MPYLVKRYHVKTVANLKPDQLASKSGHVEMIYGGKRPLHNDPIIGGYCIAAICITLETVDYYKMVSLCIQCKIESAK